MFPLDPTPFVIVYVFIVFFPPWLRYGIALISDIKFLRKSNVLRFDEHSLLKRRKRIKEFRQNNEHAGISYSKVKKWFIITLFSWFLGFLILAFVLFILDQSDLLINHSKGIY